MLKNELNKLTNILYEFVIFDVLIFNVTNGDVVKGIKRFDNDNYYL
jgi:hypothetical protein